MTVADLVENARQGNRRAVARLISLVEDGGAELGAAMQAIYPHTGGSYSVGITGAPGAGKSTLTERLIARVRRDGHAAGMVDLVGYRLRHRRITSDAVGARAVVAHHDLRAFLREQKRVLASDAAPRASDDGDSPVEHTHV